MRPAATSDGALRIDNILLLVSGLSSHYLRLSYFVLAESKGHAFVVTSNLDIAIAENLEGVVDREFQLVVALG